MNYLDLLRARRRSGPTPTMTKIRMTALQKQWASQGLCICCGNCRAEIHSYVCRDCQAKDSIDAIRTDLKALRDKILKNR